ncbi:MAG: VOC family protein, partial [Pseudomonadota bacterium]
MFKRIDHIELLTAQPERAVRFYTEALGFRVRASARGAPTPRGPLDLVS